MGHNHVVEAEERNRPHQRTKDEKKKCLSAHAQIETENPRFPEGFEAARLNLAKSVKGAHGNLHVPSGQ
jgi:hypothetical protein